MAKKPGLTGIDKVMNNLSKEFNKIENATLKGCIRAAILVRRDMETTPPLIPIDFGNLRASFFTVTSTGSSPESGGGFTGTGAGSMGADHQRVTSAAMIAAKSIKRPLVILGFSANYATFVHENVGVTFKRPGAGAKFFESALKRNKSRIISLIAEEAKIK